MNTDDMRRGFGSAAGRKNQLQAYHNSLVMAADVIDDLRKERDSLAAQCNKMADAVHLAWKEGFDAENSDDKDLSQAVTYANSIALITPT